MWISLRLGKNWGISQNLFLCAFKTFWLAFFFLSIVLLCIKALYTDEAGRPLLANECLQSHVDGEHTVPYHLHLNKVRSFTYTERQFFLSKYINVCFSLVIPLTHTLLHFHFPESCPTDSAFSLGSTGLTNFQRACCLLIPSGVALTFALIYLKTFEEQQLQMFQGWILSQLLILIYYYIDTGVQTCGLDFHFDNPHEDEEAASIENPDHDDKPDNSPDDNPDEETATADMSVNSHGKVCRFCRYLSGKFQNMTVDSIAVSVFVVFWLTLTNTELG